MEEAYEMAVKKTLTIPEWLNEEAMASIAGSSITKAFPLNYSVNSS